MNYWQQPICFPKGRGYPRMKAIQRDRAEGRRNTWWHHLSFRVKPCLQAWTLRLNHKMDSCLSLSQLESEFCSLQQKESKAPTDLLVASSLTSSHISALSSFQVPDPHERSLTFCFSDCIALLYFLSLSLEFFLIKSTCPVFRSSMSLTEYRLVRKHKTSFIYSFISFIGHP